ncbi:MAG: hypothetical protein NC911_07010 [Candidatus Omnitrophica bacterium]|nr:hypothetical protein [Candidatus Omnitrophota bacterium]
MAESQKVNKAGGRLPKPVKTKSHRTPLKKILTALAIILMAGNGYLFYQNYRQQQQRKLAEQQRRLAEEEDRKKQQKLLEEKKAELAEMLDQLQKLFKSGQYQKVKELSEKALDLARQYNFPDQEILHWIREVDTHRYMRLLAALEKEAEDIFKYQYVRRALSKIPRLPSLQKRWDRLKEKTYQNEYLVCLFLAEKTAQAGLSGQEPVLNYSTSKMYLNQAEKIKVTHSVKADHPREMSLLSLQNTLFFQETDLQEKTVPKTIYRIY